MTRKEERQHTVHTLQTELWWHLKWYMAHESDVQHSMAQVLRLQKQIEEAKRK